jgi:L-ascorbate metabolism protein UlaG (beta-lactamase superfamily)
MIRLGFLLLVGITAATAAGAGDALSSDVIATADGDLRITFIGHGTLMLEHRGRVIHVDPWSRLADYGELPDADLILITHEHRDHLDEKAIAAIRTDTTVVIGSAAVCEQLEDCRVLANGEATEALGLPIAAVAAYNLVHHRDGGEPFHPRGRGNGYVIDFAGTRVYVAGDTENTPEMKALQGIDVAFLPMNLPYTMTPEMVADAARAFRPRILYPYHYGDTDPERLVELLAAEDDIEVRVRPLR